MDAGAIFSPGRSTLGQSQLYGTPQTKRGTGTEEVNVRPKSGGTGLRDVLKNTGSDVATYSGLSLPALLALGVIAWWLFRTY